MFKMVTGGNGRTVYAGKVNRVNDLAVEIVGTEWNSTQKVEEHKSLQLFFDPEIKADKREKLHPGMTICAMVMPHRSNPNLGTAEEIALPGEAISIYNDRGNEKLILNGIVKNKKWNEKKNRLAVSFMDVKNMSGSVLGFERVYDNRSVHFMNVNFFVQKQQAEKKNYYDAPKADKLLEKGTSVIMLISKSVAQYNGKEYINLNGAKFFVPVTDEQNEKAESSAQDHNGSTASAPKPSNPAPSSQMDSKPRSEASQNGFSNPTQPAPSHQANHSADAQTGFDIGLQGTGLQKPGLQEPEELEFDC